MEYCKRLIEVDLPIKRISLHSRKEKSVRQGHVSTLHIWWARRPLAACRAVLCASLWPDPSDPLCPLSFIETAKRIMIMWSQQYLHLLNSESMSEFIKYQKNPKLLDDPEELRNALFHFITDFCDYENSARKEFLKTSQELTQEAHKSLIKDADPNPLIVDPFSGGASIPIEALRIGANTFASDLNPVAVCLNKVLIEYSPKYRNQLVDEVKKWGEKIRSEALQKMKDYYPSNNRSDIPIAYLWARTVICEGPGCGAELPLIRSKWLSKKGKKTAIHFFVSQKSKKIEIEIIEQQNKKWACISKPDLKNISVSDMKGTVKRGSVTCPICSFTTSLRHVKAQLKVRQGGTFDARFFAVVYKKNKQKGRYFRTPRAEDLKAFENAKSFLESREFDWSVIPNQRMPETSTGFLAPPMYGISHYYQLFNQRQLVLLSYLSEAVHKIYPRIEASLKNKELSKAIQLCLALCVDRQLDHSNSCCTWNPSGPKMQHLFTRQSIPIVWDFVESNPFGDSVGDFMHNLDCVLTAIENASKVKRSGTVELTSATNHPLPDKFTACFFTDPPYYNAVPYADLSDFFYVWLHKMVGDNFSTYFNTELAPKEEEICELFSWDSERYSQKTANWYEEEMTKALNEGRRIIRDDGIGIIVFAHKTTKGWESIIGSIIKSKWKVVSSWPIDTELATRLRGMNSAALGSSIHLVCRPRTKEIVGDWRDILNQLPIRIHEWMPRLQKEGIVGADAIFACLGPALEIFSQYSKVEKASGEEVRLNDYLEHVWAAVAKEALNMIFEDADASGFEEDSRLTAMWLWTLFADKTSNGKGDNEEDQESEDDSEEETTTKKKKITGYVLEYDAARKIAQGLGIHLENLKSVVDVKGETATLLSVGERARYLFNKEDITIQTKQTKRKTQESFDFMKEIEKEESDTAIINELARMNTAETTLDKLHQTMLLFVANRGEAMKRLLVEEGFGRDNNFWKLAQALSALYPAGSDEKRWVDGVLARKKGFGF